MEDDGATLDAITDALYSGPLEDFVPHRDARARRARGDGAAELAAAVAALRKPTVGAWLGNLLAHQHPAQVEQLVQLGEALREAQSVLDPDQLRALGRQRYQVVAELVSLARRRAAELGQRAGDAPARELEATLGAALSDPAAARALAEGHLTHGLTYAGFGEAGSGSTAAAAARKPSKAPAKGTTRDAEVDAAERALTQARLQAADAEAKAASGAADAKRRQDSVSALQTRVEELTQAIAQARGALTEGRTLLDKARQQEQRLALAAQQALLAADEAARTVSDLRGT